jgi:hypothetical protein
MLFERVKKFISIFLLIIMLLNGAGFYAYFAVELWQIKTEMHERLNQLPAEQLELVTLGYAEFKDKGVDEGELMYSGKMYDIARVVYCDDHIEVYCLHDEKEDNLFSFIDGIISKPLTKNQGLSNEIVQQIGICYILPNHFVIPQSDFQNIVHNKDFQFFHLSAVPETRLRPPRPAFLS